MCYLVAMIVPLAIVLDLILPNLGRNAMEETLRSGDALKPLVSLRCQRFMTSSVTFFCQPLDVQIDTFGSVFYIFMFVLCPLSGLKTHREPNLQRTKNAR